MPVVLRGACIVVHTSFQPLSLSLSLAQITGVRHLLLNHFYFNCAMPNNADNNGNAVELHGEKGGVSHTIMHYDKLACFSSVICLIFMRYFSSSAGSVRVSQVAAHVQHVQNKQQLKSVIPFHAHMGS
eukprot:3186063-Amphidinium_carterae.1